MKKINHKLGAAMMLTTFAFQMKQCKPVWTKSPFKSPKATKRPLISQPETAHTALDKQIETDNNCLHQHLKGLHKAVDATMYGTILDHLLTNHDEDKVENSQEQTVIAKKCKSWLTAYKSKLESLSIDRDDLNKQDQLGNAPLFKAIQGKNKPMVEMLLERGADPNLCTIHGQNVLHACIRIHELIPPAKYKDLLNDLCKKVNTETLNGQDKLKESAPIHMAAVTHNALLEVLINHHANVNIQDQNGNTPLHHLIMKYQSQEDQLSTEKKEEISTGVDLLCKQQGIDVNVQNQQGDTPLHLAIQTKNEEVCKLLIEKGANTYLKNKNTNPKRRTAHQLLCNLEWDHTANLLNSIYQVSKAEKYPSNIIAPVG